MPANQKSTAPFVTVPIEDAGVPIYRQIYENLQRQILSGALRARSKMPSTRTLAEQLSISRMTVVNAYEQLFAEGYIEGVSGSGTYVSSMLPEEMLETKNARRGSGKEAAKVGDKPVFSKRGERLAKVDYVNLRASDFSLRFAGARRFSVRRLVVRSLIGLLFLFASVTFFLNLVPQPELTGKMKLFTDGIAASGYLMPLVKTVELLCGIAFVSGRFVPLAVVLIAPIAVNILLVHAFLAPEGLPVAIPLFLGLLFLAYAHRKHYEPVFAAK